MTKLACYSPIKGQLVAERDCTNAQQIAEALAKATGAQQGWQALSIAERADICRSAIDYMVQRKHELGDEITLQMGRPICYSPNEVVGMADRANYMIEQAAEALADITIEDSDTCQRFIRHQPLGTVLVIAPWNYPYLTAINSIIPALMAGNCVLLKHAEQTLLCGEHFQQAFDAAGLAPGVFQNLLLDHQQTQRVMQDEQVNFVAFTGSVDAGRSIEQSLAGHFKGLALELGGKDAAYVLEDADLDHSVENLVDGAFFNSGQSCCGIERIYVHSAIYEEFIQRYAGLTQQYILGDPRDSATTLGPMVSTVAANRVRQQIQQAINQGAKALINTSLFELDSGDDAYLAPQVLVNVHHNMDIMRQESFGPVVGIMPVDSDSQAIELINDTAFGLTNSIWGQDKQRAMDIAQQLTCGTVFMNRCDYLDPALAWVGVKQSGRGCSLSKLGYQQLTRPKSFYLR